jgi:hypothetical protein
MIKPRVAKLVGQMIMRAELLERTGNCIFGGAIVLACCWIATGNERLEPYVVMAVFVGLAGELIGSFAQEYSADATNGRRRFWRRVLQFLAIVLIGGAGLSLLLYAMMLFDETTRESIQHTILMVSGIKLALGTLAILSMKFVR